MLQNTTAGHVALCYCTEEDSASAPAILKQHGRGSERQRLVHDGQGHESRVQGAGCVRRMFSKRQQLDRIVIRGHLNAHRKEAHDLCSDPNQLRVESFIPWHLSESRWVSLA